MSTIRCPRCRSEAYYNYGRTKNGKQRYICLVCNRQFIEGKPDKMIEQRPSCPLCSHRMHVYMRSSKFIRFRCSTYPRCHGYMKVSQEN